MQLINAVADFCWVAGLLPGWTKSCTLLLTAIPVFLLHKLKHQSESNRTIGNPQSKNEIKSNQWIDEKELKSL